MNHPLVKPNGDKVGKGESDRPSDEQPGFQGCWLEIAYHSFEQQIKRISPAGILDPKLDTFSEVGFQNRIAIQKLSGRFSKIKKFLSAAKIPTRVAAPPARSGGGFR